MTGSGIGVDEIKARMETARLLLSSTNESEKALTKLESCMVDAKFIDLGDDYCLLLQLLGEAHRIIGNVGQAHGFATRTLKCSQEHSNRKDEGYAFLSLALLELEDDNNKNNDKYLKTIEKAYIAFSRLYADGNVKNQTTAKSGYATCHVLRAKFYDYVQYDNALSEYTKAIGLYDELGKNWVWEVADTLLKRANLYARNGDHRLASNDVNKAGAIFTNLGDTAGLAESQLEAGELLDSTGDRITAEDHFKKAAAIAATWKNDRKASKYYFRYACKLVELGKLEEAESIFGFLVNLDCLETELKLTVVSQLCLTAQATGNDESLKERCEVALSLIETLIHDSTSPNVRRRLRVQKGQHLEQFGQYEAALRIFKKSIQQFKAIDDGDGVIECLFHIRGVMQHLGNKEREREVSEQVLDLCDDDRHSFFKAMTLLGLAQLNISQNRIAEARLQVDEAEELGREPLNPAVFLVAMDLKSKLMSESGDADETKT